AGYGRGRRHVVAGLRPVLHRAVTPNEPGRGGATGGPGRRRRPRVRRAVRERAPRMPPSPQRDLAGGRAVGRGVPPAPACRAVRAAPRAGVRPDRGARGGTSMFLTRHKREMPAPDSALPGRDRSMPVPERHFVNGNPISPPFPQGFQTAVFGMGCFWGAERVFWQTPGVWTTAVGYAGG